MSTLLENLRQVLGQADFYADNAWDYGAMIEYFVGAVVLCIVITSVFRFLGKLVSR
mgnify:CR=1 FL=1